jgi:hypothetical protein
MLWNAKRLASMEFESPNPAAASPRTLAHEAVVTEDGLALYASWEPLPSGALLVVLAGRATRVQ